MGLWMAFGFAGDLEGDFCEARAAFGFGEDARRVSDLMDLVFESPPFRSCEAFISVPLRGRLGGGEYRSWSSSSSDESTMGCFRTARSFPMPLQPWNWSEANGHSWASSSRVSKREQAWAQTSGPSLGGGRQVSEEDDPAEAVM
jgi:hypothetical protein